MKKTISIDKLIEIVSKGGSIKTGVDVFNKRGALLLERDTLVNNANVLLILKQNGVSVVPFSPGGMGGLWDKDGNRLIKKENRKAGPAVPEPEISSVEKKIKEIGELKQQASIKYKKARKSIKKVVNEIRDTGGRFDYTTVEDTISELFDFLTQNDNAFSYLTREIFAYDDYLYNHSINVCAIGMAILEKYNDHFSQIINKYLSSISSEVFEQGTNQNEVSFVNYQVEDIHDISIGYFLHDVGKVLIPDEILNKKGRLTNEEFGFIKTHSFKKGLDILQRNQLDNPFIKNVVQYHHARLYDNEINCYPNEKNPIEVPMYVKICKLADIYDAMTSKRSYKDAVNPISVVTEVFRKYAQKDRMLQFILHSFVKVVGIYPPGSIVHLRTGQLAYIIDSIGPIVLPFTDPEENPLKEKPDPINLGVAEIEQMDMNVDMRKPLLSPKSAYLMLPPYLKEFIKDFN